MGAGVEAVDDPHAFAAREQCLDDVRADETEPAGDEDGSAGAHAPILGPPLTRTMNAL